MALGRRPLALLEAVRAIDIEVARVGKELRPWLGSASRGAASSLQLRARGRPIVAVGVPSSRDATGAGIRQDVAERNIRPIFVGIDGVVQAARGQVGPVIGHLAPAARQDIGFA